MNLPEQIESLYKSGFGGPFPYKDCFLVSDRCGVARGELIPELDLFFGDIAGYASSATTLDQRPSQELLKARSWLSRGDFFERYPRLAVCRDSIAAEEMPDLWRHMKVAEELRTSLLHLLSEMGFQE
jgi:hypothetical protein